jgi:hypothetical protein
VPSAEDVFLLVHSPAASSPPSSNPTLPDSTPIPPPVFPLEPTAVDSDFCSDPEHVTEALPTPELVPVGSILGSNSTADVPPSPPKLDIQSILSEKSEGTSSGYFEYESDDDDTDNVTLSEEQLEVLKHVLERKNVFITGPAGMSVRDSSKVDLT